MSGAMLALMASLSSAIDWSDITGTSSMGFADNSPGVVMPYSTTLTAISTGLDSAQLYYVKNGTAVSYSAPFTVIAGDTLYWAVQFKSAFTGSVTVQKTGAIPIDTFNVTVTP